VLTTAYEEVKGKSFDVLLEEYFHQHCSKPQIAGYIFEEVCACILKAWSGCTVASFITEIFGFQSTLPEWTQKARLQIAKVGNFRELGFSADARVVEQMFLFPNRSSLVLRPENVMRPDLASWSPLEIGSDMFWGLFCSAKLYRKPLTAGMAKDDQNSTNPNLFYHTVDGTEVNKQAQMKYNDFQEVVKNKNICGNLRLHFALPSVVDHTILIVGNDVIAYIDQKRLEKFAAGFPEVVKLINKVLTEKQEPEKLPEATPEEKRSKKHLFSKWFKSGSK